MSADRITALQMHTSKDADPEPRQSCCISGLRLALRAAVPADWRGWRPRRGRGTIDGGSLSFLFTQTNKEKKLLQASDEEQPEVTLRRPFSLSRRRHRNRTGAKQVQTSAAQMPPRSQLRPPHVTPTLTRFDQLAHGPRDLLLPRTVKQPGHFMQILSGNVAS